MTPPTDDVASGIQAIAAGGAHTCALSMDGGVRCWGANGGGLLGDGSKVRRSTPPSRDALTGVKSLSLGESHTCAVRTDGGLRCWGSNRWGQLGDGTTIDRISPGNTDLMSDVQAVSAGERHTCALMKSGAVRCWGLNEYGQVGNGASGYVPTPSPVATFCAPERIQGMKHEKQVVEILGQVAALGSERNRAGMARYGINIDHAFGVSIYELRKLAKRLGTNHRLALALWASGNHEGRLLACFVDDPAEVTASQMDAWARDFDSWDICDQATTSLFDLSKHAWNKAAEWAGKKPEWTRRGGFTLMAGLAVHDKKAEDRKFQALFPLIEAGAFDERNFVKKAVNWALRNIGKRNLALNQAAIACAERIQAAANKRAGGERGGDPQTRAARRVAADALRELTSAKRQAGLRKG